MPSSQTVVLSAMMEAMTMPANRRIILPDPAHARSISTQSIEFVAIWP